MRTEELVRKTHQHRLTTTFQHLLHVQPRVGRSERDARLLPISTIWPIMYGGGDEVRDLLVVEEERGIGDRRGEACYAKRRFEAMLRALSGRRGELARCMAFSLEHAEAAAEV